MYGEKYYYQLFGGYYNYDAVYINVYLHDIPSFVITYKFNPPDDSLSEELVHKVIIHRDPNGHLSPGDPLPILYRIDPKNNRKVCSMPFPFAMCDVANYDEIVCFTEHGKPVNPESGKLEDIV